MPILNSSFLEKGTSGLNVADTGELLYPEARRLYYIYFRQFHASVKKRRKDEPAGVQYFLYCTKVQLCECRN
jgi:hypothetical protein